jgi:hypothetical protein
VLAVACDVPGAQRGMDGPRLVGSDPADGAEGVDRNGLVRVELDRLAAPGSVTRDTVALTSGERVIGLSVSFDPLDRAIEARPFRGVPLDPDARYTVTIVGVRDLEGRIGEPIEIAFVTGSQVTPEVRREVSWSEIEPILVGRCATSGCHAGAGAPHGLDLSSPERVRATAIGVGAAQTERGVAGSIASPIARALTGLARIEVVDGVGSPERSYLFYKALGEELSAGERMPPPGSGAPLSYDELALLRDWIRSGAPTGE